MRTNELATGKFENCWKCNGTGHLPHYAHIANGACFACGGTGKVKPGEPCSKDEIHTFVVDGLVWQFQPIHHDNLDPGNEEFGVHRRARKGERVDSVLIHCFPLGGNRRKGTTPLRCRLDTEVARKVWKEARGGMKPKQMTDEFLGIVSPCQITRNGRGIEVW